MTNPKIELHEYLNRLINHFLFIKDMDEEIKTMINWLNRPGGVNAYTEGTSFFNLVHRSFNQTLLIELCKFISDDEEKSLKDFLNKAKIHAKPLEPTMLKMPELKREVIPVKEYEEIIDKHFKEIEKYDKVIQNLKSRRDKALAHTDAAFFNNPDKHFEAYPLMADDIDQLQQTVEEILKEQALYLLEAGYDFKLHTDSGVDRVLEFMRAYYTIIHEDSNASKYRFDDYYGKEDES